MSASTHLPKLLIVDDEAPARHRLEKLIRELESTFPTHPVFSVAHAQAAKEHLNQESIDIVLLDIHMPEEDGLSLAKHIQTLAHPPAIIFITAFDQYAVQAFDLQAGDYVLKPIRKERLLAALQRVTQIRKLNIDDGIKTETKLQSTQQPAVLLVQDRDKLLPVALADILFIRAELKYLTVVTKDRDYLVENSLQHFEQEHPDQFIRIHRNTLIAKAHLLGFEKIPVSKNTHTASTDRATTNTAQNVSTQTHHDTATPESSQEQMAEPYWGARIRGYPELLQISRRQWPLVKGLF